jgi:exosortase C (VPDSG-CTERM-specific)
MNVVATPVPYRMEQEAKRRTVVFLCTIAALIAVFYAPLADMVKYAKADSLYSHVFLIPLISIYLAKIIRDGVSVVYSDYPAGFALFVAAGAFLSTIGRGDAQGFEFAQVDLLTITMISFVTCIVGAFLVIFGYDAWRVMLFPLLFLYFMAPLPELVILEINRFFQYWSGLAADALLQISGTPVYREGMVLVLPGLALEVAEECSGIRASVVLFLTSLLAGQLFLKGFVPRFVLAASIVPIAILRNAMRIMALALVTMHIDPNALHGPLHTQGGVPFFVLSLIPLFIILWLLRRGERVRAT